MKQNVRWNSEKLIKPSLRKIWNSHNAPQTQVLGSTAASPGEYLQGGSKNCSALEKR
jgi:hypothetical protein